MKKALLTASVLLIVAHVLAQVTINETGGWMEAAYVKWAPVANATSYNVYYTGGGLINQKIDDPLIRSYGSYFRADVMGISAGPYTITVKPVISGVEGMGATTGNITVIAQDRTGFAFESGRIPGGYRENGTPKPGAVILYITESTKNTVAFNVTTGSTGAITHCVGLQNILFAIKKGYETRPFIFRLIGNITDMTVMDGGDIVIENANNASSHITFEGVGSDAVANGWGVRLKTASNIEVANLGFMNCNSTAGDNVGMQQDNDHVWVHNCDMFYGNAGTDGDQVKGDGALDNKSSTFCTFSYNHFWDNGKCSLLGLSEGTTVGLFVTYHHNWFDHSDSRHPRVRYYSAHVYNNYFDGNAKYGIGSTLGASVFAEGNYFRDCNHPMMISLQGTDVVNGVANGTFSGEAGGIIKACNNTLDASNGANDMRFVPYGDASGYYANTMVDFDAYVVMTRSDNVPATVTSYSGGNKYNNFDTDPLHYVASLVPDAPDIAKTKVIAYSGRINGGDLKFTYVNSIDDASYSVNTVEKAALTNYQATLVEVQGEDTTAPGNTQTLTTASIINQTVASGVAISAIVFTWGGAATDAAVTGLPAEGLSFVKNTASKTITITGTPAATLSYSVTTSGPTGTPAAESGTITVSNVPVTSGDETHNFTLSDKSSAFYGFAAANLSTAYGSVSYNGILLTQCLKMESATTITFVTTAPGVFTLVFNPTYMGSVKVDNVEQTQNASGIVSVSLAAGPHTVAKGSGSSYLFYMSVVYSAMDAEFSSHVKWVMSIYPNPATHRVSIFSSVEVKRVEVYNLLGVLVKKPSAKSNHIDMSHLSNGTYFIRVHTKQGIFNKQIVKN